MPSITHQALATLIRDNPALGAYLFEVATGKSLPPDCELQLTSAQYTDLRPPEYSADAAYVIADTATNAGTATDVGRNTTGGGSVIFEIQLTRDDTKPAAWHHYVATMHRQSRNLVTLIVIAVTESMARWCARPLAYDHAGINTFEPVVLGPQQIPRITDFIQAKRLPALAVLSVAAHGQRDDGAEVAMAALGACKALDNDRGTQYADFVFGWLGEAAKYALEKLMAQHGYEYQSDFAKGYFSQGLEQGREEGLEQGRESGLLSGIEAICKLLALELTPERRRLLKQSSVDELERLLETLTSQQRWPE